MTIRRLTKFWKFMPAAALASIGGLALLAPASLSGERLTANGWELLAVAYPADRDVTVMLGGAEKTLTAKGLCSVKWHDNVASLELDIAALPAPAEAGWSGRQYVLWAIDSEKRPVNLGQVPGDGKGAKWKAQAPFRIFGLLVTAEKNVQATTPSSAVALESLLPTNPTLVVPVFRVNLSLAPLEG